MCLSYRLYSLYHDLVISLRMGCRIFESQVPYAHDVRIYFHNYFALIYELNFKGNHYVSVGIKADKVSRELNIQVSFIDVICETPFIISEFGVATAHSSRLMCPDKNPISIAYIDMGIDIPTQIASFGCAVVIPNSLICNCEKILYFIITDKMSSYFKMDG